MSSEVGTGRTTPDKASGAVGVFLPSKALGRDSIRFFFFGRGSAFHRRLFREEGFLLREKGLPHYVTRATHFSGEYASGDDGERSNAENCTKRITRITSVHYKSNYLNYVKRSNDANNIRKSDLPPGEHSLIANRPPHSSVSIA